MKRSIFFTRIFISVLLIVGSLPGLQFSMKVCDTNYQVGTVLAFIDIFLFVGSGLIYAIATIEKTIWFKNRTMGEETLVS
jgi:hypothetical protein